MRHVHCKMKKKIGIMWYCERNKNKRETNGRETKEIKEKEKEEIKNTSKNRNQTGLLKNKMSEIEYQRDKKANEIWWLRKEGHVLTKAPKDAAMCLNINKLEKVNKKETIKSKEMKESNDDKATIKGRLKRDEDCESETD